MICNNCGKANTGDAKFCSECGTRLLADVLPEFMPSGHGDSVSRREDSVRRLLDMALWHSDTGNYGSAMRACNAVLSIDVDNISALSILGSIYEKQGRFDDAITAFGRVVELNPDSVNADRRSSSAWSAALTSFILRPSRPDAGFPRSSMILWPVIATHPRLWRPLSA